MKENTNEKSDTLAAIGIGAMIVFIALILVAAVAAAVIIQTAEKLQKNAQTTGSETTDMLSSKVLVMSVIVPSTDALYITFELAPGSSNMDPRDVDWSIICQRDGDNDGVPDTGGAEYGTFAAASTVGSAAPVNGLLVAHTTYDITIPAGDLTNCPPAQNEDHTLLIQSQAGGFTFETLNYGSDVTAGAVVV